MKETPILSAELLQSTLETFSKTRMADHDPVDLISKAQYKKMRRDLSTTLDALAYPLPELDYNRETEWGDVIGIIAGVTEEFMKNRKKHEEITIEDLANYKYNLLSELDKMTER